MKPASLFPLFLFAATLPALAEWEARGLCYVCAADDAAAKAPEDMLTGEIYDFNRNPQGEYFAYSGVYAGKDGSRSGKRPRNSESMNPTGSPDLFRAVCGNFQNAAAP